MEWWSAIIGGLSRIVSANRGGYRRGPRQRRTPCSDGPLQTGEVVRSSSVNILIACLLAALFALLAGAADPQPIVATLRLAALPAGVDTDIGALLSGAHADEFTELPGVTLTPRPGQTQWLRATIDADWAAPSPPVLAIFDANHISIHVYAPPAYAEETLAHGQPVAQSRFSRHALVSMLPQDWRHGQAAWLRIDAGPNARAIRFELTDMATYQVADLRHVRLVTLFASVQLAMTIVGLCLWLALRDRVFAYFVGYSSVQLLYQTLASGEFPDITGLAVSAWIWRHALWCSAMLSAALAISFILEFCDLRRQTPRLAAMLGAFRWPFLLSAPLIAFSGDSLDRILPPLLNALLLLSALLAIVDVTLVAWRGSRAARFFVVAWLPQVAFTVLRVAQLLLGLPQPAWIEYGYPFTMAFSSIVLILGLADDTLHVRRERDLAHHLASYDGLTGALNRRALVGRLADAIVHVRERGTALALLFLDIDHFKAINDAHGHPAGDVCLRAVARHVAAGLQPPQVLGRYGGEEFVAILPGASDEEAVAVAERLRRSIEALAIDADDTRLHLTVSIGVAAMASPNEQPDQLIAKADRALYQAKSDGRNCVRAAAAIPFTTAAASPA